MILGEVVDSGEYECLTCGERMFVVKLKKKTGPGISLVSWRLEPHECLRLPPQQSKASHASPGRFDE